MAAIVFLTLLNCHLTGGIWNKNPQSVYDSNQISHLKDSLLHNLDQFHLVVQKQQFNWCFAIDSVYYNSDDQIVLSKGNYGCKKNVTHYIALFESKQIVYHEQYSMGDGLPYNKRVLFSKNGIPQSGIKTDYELGWIDRKILDSTSVELSDLQLKATYLELKNNTKELFNLQNTILKCAVDSAYNEKTYLNYRDQNTYDKWTFVVDSDYYEQMK